MSRTAARAVALWLLLLFVGLQPALTFTARAAAPAHSSVVTRPGEWPAVPDAVAIGAALDVAAAGALPAGYPSLHGTPRVPPALLKAIAWVESRWRQFRSPGVVLASPDGGYGVMQVTSPMAAGRADETVQSAIANNYIYNIAYGAQMLSDKWLSTPLIGSGDPDVLESWYYAVWAFNGWGWVNNPNNPSYTRVGTPATSPWAYPYQERVYYVLAHPPQDASGRPLWPAVDVALPTASAIKAANVGPLPLALTHTSPAAPDGPLLPCPTPPGGAASQRPMECVPWADRAVFLSDQGTPDGATVTPNQDLLKGWLLWNTGGTFWNSAAARTNGYHLQRLGDGDGFGGPTRIDVPETPPLATVMLQTHVTAPLTPGAHTAYWQMQDGQDHPFGLMMWISVVVSSSGPDSSPAPTLTPAPPPSPTAVPTPDAGRTRQTQRVAAFRLKAADALYAGDLSVPDWMVMTPGQHFDKGWRLRNVGTITWNPAYHLAFQAGTRMGPLMMVRAPVVAPAATGVFTVALVAPLKPGRYRSIWQMTDPDARPFGQQVWVAITVAARRVGTPTPTVSPDGSPSPTGSPSADAATPTPAATPSPLPIAPTAQPPTPSPTASASPTVTLEWLGPVAYSAYFAEGYTGGQTQQYLSLFNPGVVPAGVRLTIYRADGASRVVVLALRPDEVRSVNVARLAPRASVALRIEADHFVAAERVMYAGTGGHAAAAISRPSRHWMLTHFLMESGYQEWLPLFNPNDEALTATVTITPAVGAPHALTALVPPHTRVTLSLARYLGGRASRAISVDAPLPLVAEHVAYFNKGRSMVAHSGAAAPSAVWYFAEARTDGGHMAYISVVNPTGGTATVTLTLRMSDGSWQQRYVLISPHGSHVFGLHHIARSPGLSATVRATAPIYAEEALYLPGRRGAALIGGASRAARAWYLAEGYTGGGYRESVFIFNPGNQGAIVRVRYATGAGAAQVKWVHVPARGRASWMVNGDVAPGNVAITFNAAVPIVVSRGEEFHDGWGLTSALAILGPPAAL